MKASILSILTLFAVAAQAESTAPTLKSTRGITYTDGMFDQAVSAGHSVKRQQLSARMVGDKGALFFPAPYRQYDGEALKALPNYLRIYKEDADGMTVDDTAAWQIDTGNRLSCAAADFDRSATYYADYLVFDYLEANLSELNIDMKRGTVEFFAATEWDYPQAPGEIIGLFALIGVSPDNENIRLHMERRGAYWAYKAVFGSTLKVDANVGAVDVLKAGEFHHYAVTWDEKEYRFYQDGVLRTAGVQPAISAKLKTLVIGSLPDTPPNFYGCRFWGWVDEFRLSKTVRSAQEIEDAAQGLEPYRADADTVALYRFDADTNPAIE